MSDGSSSSPPPREGVYRLLDANANRAREALRVMEDTSRFVLDDANLTRQAKHLRHDFAAALRRLPYLAADRDILGDVGTVLTTEAERTREDASDIAVAAGKRLSEALRCCEEYGKLVDVDFAATVKNLRYRGYELERALHLHLVRPVAAQWRLCVIVSEPLCVHHDWLSVARAAVHGGADCIQLREKDLADSELLDRATRLVEAVGEAADVIINDRPDIALLAGAAGVHLGTDDLPVAAVHARFGRRLLVGASTHDLDEARAAIEAGADYCGVGAIFATSTKPREASGLEYLRRFRETYPNVPHLAIGGIDAANIHQVTAAGARGVAVSSAICRAADPEQATRDLLHARRQPDAHPPHAVDG